MSDCYPPRLGGIETQVRDLARQLRVAGHDVAVFTATPGSDRRSGQEWDEGVRVHRITARLPFDLPVNPRAPRIVRPMLAGCDVVHVHAGIVSPFAHDMAELALAQRIPTVVTWHSLWGSASRAAFAVTGSPRRWGSRGAVLTAVSSVAASRIAAVAGGARVGVLPNGIDPARWLPDPALGAGASTGAPPGEAPSGGAPLRIATAIRLAPRKRVLPLLRILRSIRARVPASIPLEATVFGDGPLLGLARAARHGDDWIHLPGRVPREHLARAYAGADLYLSPARMESFGIAALEARTAGLPVVALGGSGTTDFVSSGVEGLLAADDAGLAAAATRLLTDDALRAAIARHNRLTVPAQSWPAVVATTEGRYREACRCGGPIAASSDPEAPGPEAPGSGHAESGRAESGRAGSGRAQVGDWRHTEEER